MGGGFPRIVPRKVAGRHCSLSTNRQRVHSVTVTKKRRSTCLLMWRCGGGRSRHLRFQASGTCSETNLMWGTFLHVTSRMLRYPQAQTLEFTLPNGLVLPISCLSGQRAGMEGMGIGTGAEEAPRGMITSHECGNVMAPRSPSRLAYSLRGS
ncbi:hypothetical protein N656DRAFT_785505 [Canariomyces notabilis]|uniref:Uncharacterized protein n=1 Tax=Canariomyces notabilis TaxID=2074819 RepID=A0AAN6T6T5_9PEZI|nr:hypothetical protein N656DRAFT_785505 [Canariomyces arenarius]